MGKQHSVKITSIVCNKPSESSGDEVYLTYQADALDETRYPKDFKSSHEMDNNKDQSVWNVNLILEFDYEVLLCIWDNDDVNPDYLQSHDFEPGTGSGSIRLKNTNDADYTINYSYIN